MKISKLSPKLSLCLILLLAISCHRDKVTPPGTSTPAPPSGIAENGLSGADRQNFYHLAEGSELFPYAWMKALNTASDQPFLQNPERFGLIPDPGNADGLPIGLTRANRLGVPLGEMVGVNCAACHVAELKYQNTSYRVDGGQNLFDLGSFYGELFEDTKAAANRRKTESETVRHRRRESGRPSDRGARSLLRLHRRTGIELRRRAQVAQNDITIEQRCA